MTDYPTDEQLDRIRTWALPRGPWAPPPAPQESLATAARAWFDFIKTAWWMPEWGWSEETTPTQTTLHISTGGWSGNEAIIEAMHQHVLWTMTWESSRRGGHYTFRFSTIQETPTT